MLKRLLFCFLIGGALFSCKKDQDPQPVLNVSDITLRYDTYPKVSDFELIIAQKDGKILLDTLIASHESHTLSVKSIDTQFNVTALLFDPVTKMHVIRTYLQVNPNEWHLNNMGGAPENAVIEEATITYTDLPAYDNSLLFMSRAFRGASMTWSGSTFEVNYDRLVPADVAYFILPKYGKYMLTDITSTHTTASYTEARDTKKFKFNKPAGISQFWTNLYGYSNDGKHTSRMMLFGFSGAQSTAEYDLQSPTTGFGQFDLHVNYYDAEKYRHTYSFYETSIPSEIDFEAKSDFSVTKPGFDDFEVTFDANKPILYKTQWKPTDTSIKAIWEVISPPNENSFKPKTFLENLNSKTLAGAPLPALKLSFVSSEKVKDRSYQAVLDHLSNAEVREKNPIKHARTITKYF